MLLENEDRRINSYFLILFSNVIFISFLIKQ